MFGLTERQEDNAYAIGVIFVFLLGLFASISLASTGEPVALFFGVLMLAFVLFCSIPLLLVIILAKLCHISEKLEKGSD